MKRRSGLTLVELLIVLTILIAVASIVIPLLPNVLNRTQQATDSTQINELARAIQSYQSSYGGYPQDYDLLLDSSGAFPTITNAAGTATTYIPAPTTGAEAGVPLGGYAVPATLTSAELTALYNAGIRYVQPMADATISPNNTTTPLNFQATLNPYGASTLTGNRIDLTTAGTSQMFAVIDPNTNTNLPTTFLQVPIAADQGQTQLGRYVLFGVGSRCSMVAKTIQEAPLAAPLNRFASPANTYFRYGVIFRVSGAEITGSNGNPGTNTARMVATVSMENGILQTSEQNVVNFNAQQQN